MVLVDNDQDKLSALKTGDVPIHEKFLPELLLRHRGRKLKFSDDLYKAVRASKAIFIAVGTPPTEQGEADLSYVESVARSISAVASQTRLMSGDRSRNVSVSAGKPRPSGKPAAASSDFALATSNGK